MIDLSKPLTGLSNVVSGVCIPNLADKDGESKVNCYEELLYDALLKRASQRDTSIDYRNQDKIYPHIKRIIEWLRTTDFYAAPASTKYHDACYAGLLTHTLEVYNQLVGLQSVPKFKGVVEDQWYSAVFAVLVHDWCKIGRYKSYYKNVKDDSTGEWIQVPAYTYKEDGTCRLGHGTQSLTMTMQLCSSKLTSLTFDEMAAIRWHMDNWDVTRYEVEDLSQCNNNIPIVRMVQFADQLAVTEY